VLIEIDLKDNLKYINSKTVTTVHFAIIVQRLTKEEIEDYL